MKRVPSAYSRKIRTLCILSLCIGDSGGKTIAFCQQSIPWVYVLLAESMSPPRILALSLILIRVA